jgi:cell division protease FtsH
MLARICVAFGGREAEQLLFDDVSWGCSQDLQQATQIARHMVELYGMGGADVGSASVPATDPEGRWRRDGLSPAQLEAVDRRIREILEEQRQRAAAILRENRALVETLRDLLIEKRVIEAKTLKGVLGDLAPAKAAAI